MTEKENDLVWGSETPKRGRKPINQKAMTAAERQQRRRMLARDAGAKEFLVQLEGLHLQKIEELAQQQNITASNALKQLVQATLDRYVGLLSRCERLLAEGGTDEEIRDYMQQNFFPPLPDVERKSETK